MKKIFTYAAIISIFIWLGLVINGLYSYSQKPHLLTYFGQIGDSFGALSCLLTGGALLATLHAIQQQNEITKNDKIHAEQVVLRSKIESFLDALHDYPFLVIEWLSKADPESKAAEFELAFFAFRQCGQRLTTISSLYLGAVHAQTLDVKSQAVEIGEMITNFKISEGDPATLAKKHDDILASMEKFQTSCLDLQGNVIKRHANLFAALMA